MSLKTFVKIGNISNLSDARYCAGMMVDILGFNLTKNSEGYVSPETFKEISDWVAGVQFAGEFGQSTATDIKLAVSDYQIDYIETENSDDLEELSELPQQLIFKTVISTEADLNNLASRLAYAEAYVAYVVIDCQKPSLFENLRKELLAFDSIHFLRSYGITEASAPAVATDQVFHGIQLQGTQEERPGFHDYGEVMDILETLEED